MVQRDNLMPLEFRKGGRTPEESQPPSPEHQGVARSGPTRNTKSTRIRHRARPRSKGKRFCHLGLLRDPEEVMQAFRRSRCPPGPPIPKAETAAAADKETLTRAPSWRERCNCVGAGGRAARQSCIISGQRGLLMPQNVTARVDGPPPPPREGGERAAAGRDWGTPCHGGRDAKGGCWSTRKRRRTRLP